MNSKKLDLRPGEARTDGVHNLRFWGKTLENLNTRHLVYIFFDENDECHELSSSQVLKLEYLTK